MAVKLNTGGKIVIVVLGLALIGVAAWVWLIPKKGEEEGIKPEFTATDKGDDTDKAPDGAGKGTPDAKPAGGDDVATPGLGRPIRVGIVTWGGYAGGIYANNGFPATKDSIFFKEYGITVELKVIDDYPASRTAFKLGGDKDGVDIVWATVDSYALEYDQLKELEPKVIMQYDWSRGGDAIAVSEEIKEVSDLKGKRIAVAEGTPSHYFALYMLAQADLSTTDVNFTFTDSAIEAAQIFRQGRADAAVSWSPDVYQAAKDRKGGHILASTREATNLIADVFVVRGDFAKKHKGLVAKFVLGWLHGVDAVNKKPELSYDLMAKGFEGVDKEAAKGMFADVKLPSYSENLAFFEVTGDQLRGYEDIFTEASNIWRKLSKISGRTQASATVDPSFLAAIRAEAEKRFGKVEEEKVKEVAAKEFDFKFSEAEKEAAKEAKPILTKRISVSFPSGKFELDSNAKYILDDAARLAQTFGATRMRVTGNTDSVGNAKSNRKLSEKRAQSVVDYLVQKHGFPPDKFYVVGAGPDNPVADNTTEEGRGMNRRTDFEIIK